LAAPKEIAALVEKFDRNLLDYRSSSYNEAQTRQEFINPFFKALGWDDPTQKLLLTMVAAFAEFEKSLIASRLSSGRKTKARQGGYAGGKAPIGYRANKGDKALQLDEEKAVVVRRVFELRDAMPDASLQKLADTLNAEGHTTKHGKPFHAMQIKRILDRRSLYEGRYKYKDVEADGQHPAIIN